MEGQQCVVDMLHEYKNDFIKISESEIFQKIKLPDSISVLVLSISKVLGRAGQLKD